jgi:ATP-binding cassette subfamily B protein
VIEDGSHEQLLRQGGHYARLWSRQFSDALDEVAL